MIIERTYALSDIHGHIEPLRAALELVGLDRDSAAELVLLGDYVDRGPASADVLITVRELCLRFPDRVTALLGNHDDWFLDWLDGGDEDFSWLMGDADLGTVKSFLTPLELAHALGHDDPSSDASALDGPTMNHNIKNAILTKHSGLVGWLRRLPRVHETDDQIFVHAGIDEEAGEQWRAATPDYVFTEKFPPTFGSFVKTVIAGHVRTSEMHEDGSHGTFHDGDSHYYIDGSVEVTGRLNVLRFSAADGTDESFVAGPAAETG
ncbi:metallophosphoesterase [Brevibacterium sediminis]|uniref:Serine/threonine protein phosphatase n=1 Tax=Brevibacterium sediminis TaxID=1857024 RepID=A0A5C4X4F6_9MICO|nr:metallophosphoesterase [Brevibacterium sediminis]TNM55339.1 serine/threonine protein phosphatase [Brevibacterium sediminis]